MVLFRAAAKPALRTPGEIMNRGAVEKPGFARVRNDKEFFDFPRAAPYHTTAAWRTRK